MSDRLFNDDSNRPKRLFDDDPPHPVAPLFDPAAPVVEPVFNDATAPAGRLFDDTPTVAPILPVEPLAAPPVEPALAVESLKTMPTPSHPTVVTAMFDGEDDPIVRQALHHAQQRFPTLALGHGRLLHDRFREIFPLEFKKITGYGETALIAFQATIGSVTETATHVITVADTVTQIVQEAQAGNDHSSGLKHLIHTVEHALAPFDAAGAYSRLDYMAADLKTTYDRLLVIAHAASEALNHLKVDGAVLSIAVSMAEKTTFETYLSRRRDTVVIGIERAIKLTEQIAALKTQTEATILQIDEVCNTTLPSLGIRR